MDYVPESCQDHSELIAPLLIQPTTHVAHYNHRKQSIVIVPPQPREEPWYIKSLPESPPSHSRPGRIQPGIRLNGYPPGLECLTQIDQIVVHEQTEPLETAFTGYEMENKYVVKNNLGQTMFYAAEQSSCLQRWFCSRLRSFQMLLMDSSGQEMIHLSRPLACQNFLFPCCLQAVEVCSPPGTVIGSIQQRWSIYPDFDVKDAAGNCVLRVKGPLFPFSCCGSVINFDVFAKDGRTKVGNISKQWAGAFGETLTNTDAFGIDFPVNMNVRMKAVLLGACFLIDFVYFEDSNWTSLISCKRSSETSSLPNDSPK